MGTTIERSLVVPVFNGARHLPLFCATLAAVIDDATEVVVVDDGSTEPVQEHFSQLLPPGRLCQLRNDVPRGFSAAVNSGCRKAQGKYLFLLNSDLILTPGCLIPLTRALKTDTGLGAVSAKLLYPQSGRVQHIGLGFTPTRVFHVFHHARPNSYRTSLPRETQALAFALCALPREVFDHAGPLDEDYYNSYEDIDYSLRLRALGYRLLCTPEVPAFHWERQSGPGRNVARKDNIARLWARWGGTIQSDLDDYLGESSLELQKDNRVALSKSYILVVLATGLAANGLITLLTSGEIGISVSDIWEHPQSNFEDQPFQLPLILKPEASRVNQPFLYLVDELPQLSGNSYWFAVRRESVDDELIIDLCGNLDLTSTLFPGRGSVRTGNLGGVDLG